MAKAAPRKPPVRKKSAKKPTGRAWRHFAWKLAAVLLLLFLGFMFLLDAWVLEKFSGSKWAMPAKVYARPLELFAGRKLTQAQLLQELQVMGYRQGDVSKPGSYQQQGNTLRIHSRGFHFSDGDEPATLFSVIVRDGQVRWLSTLEGEDRPIIRLEPLQIGGIYPQHNEDRMLIQLAEVPAQTLQALIAVEDQGFRSHFGVSPTGIARALFANVRSGHIAQGGSTLTQQLVKNFFLTSERSYSRKLMEMAMAVVLELHFSKDEILEAYLNEVYLGQSGPRAIHGFGLASQYYFNARLEQLRLEQVALLVGMVKGPSYYDPWRHPENAIKRRDLVLDVMAAEGVISSELAASTKLKPLGVGDRDSKHRASYPAYVDLVRRQLQQEYQADDLGSKGLQIFTNFDPTVQWQAEASIQKTMASLRQRYGAQKVDPLQAAAVVTAVDNGDVLAVIGDKEARFSGFNRAVDASRPVGSLMKPAVYLTALQRPRQYTLATILDDSPVRVKAGGKVWQPKNYDRKSYGAVPLHQALALSLNQATARLGLDLGVGNVLKTVHKLGVEKDAMAVPSLLLGSLELPPIEVATLYQTIAGGGFHSPLNTIRVVLDQGGQPLKRYPVKVEQRVDAESVYLLRYAMQTVVREGTARAAYSRIPSSVDLAGKTGTSDDMRDSWFAGFDAEQLMVVWMGRDDNEPTPFSGASAALPAWIDYMANKGAVSLAGNNVPEGIEYAWVDDKTGLRSAESCAGARYLPFVAGSVPSGTAPCIATSTPVRNWFRSMLNGE